MVNAALLTWLDELEPFHSRGSEVFVAMGALHQLREPGCKDFVLKTTHGAQVCRVHLECCRPSLWLFAAATSDRTHANLPEASCEAFNRQSDANNVLCLSVLVMFQVVARLWVVPEQSAMDIANTGLTSMSPLHRASS
ncbi:unnamed protein product [Effrenium voratum]|uniref:Uncharacterized protein n=1 Tax=Effrenium voratum TaxID=2562239 RepID=A0AA36IB11_9DINO|nr:unnamed protein product [Effrenium voratum]